MTAKHIVNNDPLHQHLFDCIIGTRVRQESFLASMFQWLKRLNGGAQNSLFHHKAFKYSKVKESGEESVLMVHIVNKKDAIQEVGNENINIHKFGVNGAWVKEESFLKVFSTLENVEKATHDLVFDMTRDITVFSWVEWLYELQWLLPSECVVNGVVSVVLRSVLFKKLPLKDGFDNGFNDKIDNLSTVTHEEISLFYNTCIPKLLQEDNDRDYLVHVQFYYNDMKTNSVGTVNLKYPLFNRELLKKSIDPSVFSKNPWNFSFELSDEPNIRRVYIGSKILEDRIINKYTDTSGVFLYFIPQKYTKNENHTIVIGVKIQSRE
eukprot:GHVR01063198.1.p1 GENE.GHVR01063198.1~~GHVR01063198.1.p1  ORF type:complete len:322 (-),score=44.85 GHVR01063198.1:280-1245(-)